MNTEEQKVISRKIKVRLTPRHLEKLLREIDIERYEDVYKLSDIKDRVKFVSLNDKPTDETRGKLVLTVSMERPNKTWSRDIRIYYGIHAGKREYMLDHWNWCSLNELPDLLDKYTKFFILFTEFFGFRDKTAIPVYI